MNETGIYIMYTYDLCNDYFQKTISTKTLNKNMVLLGNCIFSNEL